MDCTEHDEDTMYGLLDADQLWELYARADEIRSRISADIKWSMEDVRQMSAICQYIKEAARVEERETVRREARQQVDTGFRDYVMRGAE